MSKKKEILSKIKIVLTQEFKSPEDAFAFFDGDKTAELNQKEIKKLLKTSKINRFLRGVVTAELLKKFDENENETISWKEFRKAIKKL